MHANVVLVFNNIQVIRPTIDIKLNLADYKESFKRKQRHKLPRSVVCACVYVCLCVRVCVSNTI